MPKKQIAKLATICRGVIFVAVDQMNQLLALQLLYCLMILWVLRSTAEDIALHVQAKCDGDMRIWSFRVSTTCTGILFIAQRLACQR